MKRLEQLEKQCDDGDVLTHLDFFELTLLLQKDRDELRKTLDHRNEVEGKAHALFTEPLNGYTFAHLPEQCNPLGFVEVMREALRACLEGKILPKPSLANPNDTR